MITRFWFALNLKQNGKILRTERGETDYETMNTETFTLQS